MLWKVPRAPLECRVVCSGPKVDPKRCQKEVKEGFKKELKNRTPAKYGKCGFDTVFTRFSARRHSQKYHILGVFWGTKVGLKNRSTRKPFRSMPLEALVSSWRVFWRPALFGGRGGGTECLFGGPQGEDNRRGRGQQERE